jgi:hypothetical protein
MWNEGTKSFVADEKLEAHRRVKIDTTNTTAVPPKVLYADAGEDYIGVTEFSAATGDLVSVKMNDAPGTFEIECTVSSAINVGTTLYGAADGKVSDASNGTAQGIALQQTATSNEHIEVAPWNVKATTAATVSIADAGAFTDETTVEAALQEIYQDLLTAQHFIPIPLMSLREATTFDVGNIAANGGLLASDTTPILEAINAGTDGCQRLTWATGNVDQVIAQVPLPPDLDATANVVVHARVASSGATDTPSWTMESFFNEGDTLVSDTLAAGSATSTYAEITGTIASADVPAGAQTMTVGFTPASHDGNHFYMTALWVECTRSILTS